MAMKPGLRVSQGQRLALTPGLRQSLGVLKLSSQELGVLVAEEIEQNPLLVQEFHSVSRPAADFDYAIETVAEAPSLVSHLRQQLVLTTAPEMVRQVASYLAGDLNEQGFLSEDATLLAETLSLDVAQIEQARALLQTCEPTGIGARDLRQCLDLQLISLGESPVNRALIVDNLGLFAEANWPMLRHISDLKLVEIKRLAGLLQSLNPYPATAFTGHTAPILYPDIRVTNLPEGGYSVELVNSLAPSLRVDQALFDQTKSAQPEAQDYLQDRLGRAASLIRAIEARSKTILQISKEIVMTQHRFFALGHSHLVPQTQAEIAAKLNLHPSTITRALANKALISPLGMFPLKFFFTRSLNSLISENSHSAYVIQQEIRKLTKEEPPLSPLSDAKIATILQNSGVDIARRTVAKYRQCLNIPSSVQRRRSRKVL